MFFVSPHDFWDVHAVCALCLYSAEMDLEHPRAKKVWRVKGPCSLLTAAVESVHWAAVKLKSKSAGTCSEVTQWASSSPKVLAVGQVGPLAHSVKLVLSS